MKDFNDIEDLAKGYLEAYNDNDVEQMMKYIHPEIEYDPPGYVRDYFQKESFSGKASFKNLIRKMMR